MAKIKHVIDSAQPAKYFYVLHNSIILHSAYDAELWELRILGYFLNEAVNRFKKSTKTDKDHWGVTHDQFIRCLGLSKSTNSYYYMNKTIELLKNATVNIKGKKPAVPWFKVVLFKKISKIDKHKTLYAEFNEELIPYLLVEKYFTKCSLDVMFSFKSKYSWRIYEILQATLGAQSKKIDGVRKTYYKAELNVKKLRKNLCLEDKYTNNTMFYQRIIQAAIDEINNISYKKLTVFVDEKNTDTDTITLICSGETDNGISTTERREYHRGV